MQLASFITFDGDVIFQGNSASLAYLLAPFPFPPRKLLAMNSVLCHLLREHARLLFDMLLSELCIRRVMRNPSRIVGFCFDSGSKNKTCTGNLSFKALEPMSSPCVTFNGNLRVDPGAFVAFHNCNKLVTPKRPDLLLLGVICNIIIVVSSSDMAISYIVFILLFSSICPYVIPAI